MKQENPDCDHQFYFWDASRWVKFPSATNTLLAEAYGKNVESLIVRADENRSYKIDLRSKLQMNLKTGYVRSIAWEFYTGAGSTAREGFDRPREMQELLPWSDGVHFNPQTCESAARSHGLHDIQTRCSFQSKAVHTFSKLGDNVVVLKSGDKEFSAVKKVFHNGFPRGDEQPRFTLTAVHKVVNSDAKLRYFGDKMNEMERSRGNANLRYAWHGSSADAIVSIIIYGFGQRPLPFNGNNYGCGTYLAPCSKFDVSAKYAEVDDNMQQHALLCEVVLGESEVIPPGSSHRFLPSSTSYDSGTDDVDNPNLYIIWPPFINSHIIPWYIVSFVAEEAKLAGPLRRSKVMSRAAPYSNSARQPPIVEQESMSKFFSASGLRSAIKSAGLNLLAESSTNSSASTGPHESEVKQEGSIIDGSKTGFADALNASTDRLGAAKRFRNLDGRSNVTMDGTARLCSSALNLNLSLGYMDGFAVRSSRDPKKLQSSRIQQ